MFSQRNIGWTLIGDNVAYTSGTTLNGLADGEVAILDAFGTVVTTGSAAAGQKFRIVQGRGTGLSARRTALFDPADLVYFKSKRHYNPAEQVTAVGFNGTTGSIDAQNSTSYILRLYLIEGDRHGFAQQEIIHGATVTDASATQWEIARDVAANINANCRKRKEQDVSAVCLLNVAGATEAASLTAVGNNEVNVVNGSDVFNQGAVAWNSTPAVGEVIVLDNVAGVGYEVVEIISSTSVRVHMPYEGATATNQDAIAYTAASVAGVACGIRLTGVARGFNANLPGLYSKVRWETQLENFGNTTLTSVTAPADGSGNYQQVAKEEYFAESVFGNRYRKDHLFTATVDTDLSGATYYGCLSLAFKPSHQVAGIGPEPKSPQHVKVYVGDGAADSSWSSAGIQAANLLTILNTILGTSNTYA